MRLAVFAVFFLAIPAASQSLAGGPGVIDVPAPAAGFRYETRDVVRKVVETIIVDEEYEATEYVPQTVTRTRQVPQQVEREITVQELVAIPVDVPEPATVEYPVLHTHTHTLSPPAPAPSRRGCFLLRLLERRADRQSLGAYSD